jgi:oxygen-independent coproporphyrinogen III oxidase
LSRTDGLIASFSLPVLPISQLWNDQGFAPLCELWYSPYRMDTYSLYLHVPFCRHRCAYCDFNTYAGQENLIPAYVDALCQEINLVSQSLSERLPVHTIFFGGGTPSLLSPAQFEKIMRVLGDRFSLQAELEATLEANPGTVSLETLQGLRSAGLNRISFGVQSAHPDDLRLLERQHNYLDVIQAVEWARKAGFDNLSLDLIFGLPFQPLERWQSTVELALGLNTEHLSLYALTVEHGTPFRHWAERGLVPMPDDDLAADMYDWACERLQKAGFEQYEISNWACRDSSGQLLSSKHNLQYWRNQPYLGFGAGAHGFAGGYRTANVLGIQAYIQRCREGQQREFPLGPALANALPVDRWTEMQETMMVGLRLIQEGVSNTAFTRRFGQTMEQAFGKQIQMLVGQSLLEWEGDRLRLTPNGKLLGNRVFIEFVGE